MLGVCCNASMSDLMFPDACLGILTLFMFVTFIMHALLSKLVPFLSFQLIMLFGLGKNANY